MKESYAAAIFPKVACLLNHSCNPNYSVANENIYPGEVIIKTKAVASTVKTHNSKDYCYHCLLFTMAPIPCAKCAAVVFCSSFCYEAAKERYILFL